MTCAKCGKKMWIWQEKKLDGNVYCESCFETVQSNKGVEYDKKLTDKTATDIEERGKYDDYASFSSILGFIGLCIWFFSPAFLPIIVYQPLGLFVSILSFYYYEKAKKHGVKKLLPAILSGISLVFGITIILATIVYIYVSGMLAG